MELVNDIADVFASEDSPDLKITRLRALRAECGESLKFARAMRMVCTPGSDNQTYLHEVIGPIVLKGVN